MEINGIAESKKILEELKTKTAGKRLKLAIFWVGENFDSKKYVGAKQEAASVIGAEIQIFKFNDQVLENEISEKLVQASKSDFDGIMIQLPLPAHLNRKQLISLIPADKDADGLRFCAGLESEFAPAVVEAIFKAIEISGINIELAKIAVIGKGFLVGSPLERLFVQMNLNFEIFDKSTDDISSRLKDKDLIISATGVAGLVKAEMIKDGVVLIDAGVCEESGKIAGDIDPGCYKKALKYTPVPGGIGPMTVAMLMKNLVASSKR